MQRQPPELVQGEPASPLAFLPLEESHEKPDAEIARLTTAFESDASSEDVRLQFDAAVLLTLCEFTTGKAIHYPHWLGWFRKKRKSAQASRGGLSPKTSRGTNRESIYLVLPVGADWTGNENILGYPDGLDSKRYVSRPALEIMLHGRKEPRYSSFLDFG